MKMRRTRGRGGTIAAATAAAAAAAVESTMPDEVPLQRATAYDVPADDIVGQRAFQKAN